MLGDAASLRSIAPGVVQVPLRGSSAFLLLDQRVTLIDTGPRGSGGHLLRAVRLAGRSTEAIERVVITHYHPDHLGGLPELQRVLPARTAIHAVEAGHAMSAAGPPSPFANPLLRYALGPIMRRALPHSPVRIDELLHDGDELPVLGGVRIIHTPGHTPGHIALHVPELALLIAGDALEYRAGRLSGPSRVFTADKAAAIRSIRRLAGLSLDVIAFSHFPHAPAGGGELLRELAGPHPRPCGSPRPGLHGACP